MIGDKQKQKSSSKISNTYIKKVDKKATTPYLIKKGKGAKRIWVPKEIITTMKSTKKVWIPKGK
jgi:hypothetical protein